MKNKYFILIIFSLLCLGKINTIIVFPYSLGIPTFDYIKANYSINDFFLDYYYIDLYTSIFIGQNNLRILTRISTDIHTFFLSEEECRRKSADNVKNYGIVSHFCYQLYQSSSYKNISFLNNSFTNYKNGGIISETFSFFNTTKLMCHPSSYKNSYDKEIDSKVTLNDTQIIIEEFTDKKVSAVIGLGSPYFNSNEGINLIKELKRIKAINDYSYTFKYVTSTDGQLIIGNLPHEYYNSNKYDKNEYVKINSNSPNDFNFPWSISFNKIFLNDKSSDAINIQNNFNCIIVPNLGFIIGTNNYRKLIYENYFKSLINEGTCKISQINNIYNKFDLKNEIFETFYCEIKLFDDKYKSLFPKLNFQQNDLNYIFYFSFYDLFVEIQDRYYFLITFPEEKYSNNNWYLGIPFLKRYQLVFNFDSKTIGFYNDKIDENKNKPNSNSTEGNTDKNNPSLRLIIEIIIIVILVGLIIVSYFVGKKINEKRKKRANELANDNYEYLASPENDLNIGINK
jgi:hypothetical protein